MPPVYSQSEVHMHYTTKKDDKIDRFFISQTQFLKVKLISYKVSSLLNLKSMQSKCLMETC